MSCLHSIRQDTRGFVTLKWASKPRIISKRSRKEKTNHKRKRNPGKGIVPWASRTTSSGWYRAKTLGNKNDVLSHVMIYIENGLRVLSECLRKSYQQVPRKLNKLKEIIKAIIISRLYRKARINHIYYSLDGSAVNIPK